MNGMSWKFSLKSSLTWQGNTASPVGGEQLLLRPEKAAKASIPSVKSKMDAMMFEVRNMLPTAD